MTHPLSGSSIDATAAHRVTDPDAAKLLVDEGYRTVLDAFIGHERSVSEAAEVLRLDLEETFLELHFANARVMAKAAARALRASGWAGYRIQRGDDGRLWMRGGRADGGTYDSAADAAGPADASVELRHSTDGAERLNSELVALVERYVALDRYDEGPPNRAVLFASVPLEAGL